mgnify:CR=1 FL=1
MISIITCVFNGITTIQDTIESVRKQSEVEYEHIIVDGKSTDGTIELVKEYTKKDSNIKLFSDSDNGIYDAYNKGIKYSKGSHIIFLNADDFFSNDALMIISKNINKKSDILAFDLSMLNEDYSFIKNHKRSSIKKHNINNPVILTPALVFKKILFKNLGLFDVSYRICGDYDFIARSILAKKTISYHDGLVTYMREGGISSDYKFEILKKKEHIRIHLKYSAKFSIKHVLSLIINAIKSILLRTVFKSRFIKKKKSVSDHYNDSDIFWFNKNTDV